MLVLSRKPLERVRIRIGDVVGYVSLMDLRANSAALGFEFPHEVHLRRLGPVCPGEHTWQADESGQHAECQTCGELDSLDVIQLDANRREPDCA